MQIGNAVMDMSEKVAIVTGAAGRIGVGVVRTLAEAGASVVLVDVQEKAVRTQADDLTKSGFQALALGADLSKDGEEVRVVEAAVSEFGGIDVLVNNASILDSFGEFLDFDTASIDRILGVNLRGTLLMTQAVVRQMRTQGRGGSVISMTSVGGSQRAHHNNLVYGVAKGGIDALTRALATNYGPIGIRANAIGPSAVTNLDPTGRGQDTPLRRGGTPEDVAQAVLYFASPASAFVTGQILYVDGGVSAQLRSPGAQDAVLAAAALARRQSAESRRNT